MSLQKEIEFLIMWQDNLQGQDRSYEDKSKVIINKVLDAVVEAIKKQQCYACDVYYNSASPSEDEYGNCINKDKTIESIGHLRSVS